MELRLDSFTLINRKTQLRGCMKIRAAVSEKKGGPFVFREEEISELNPDDALVRIVSKGGVNGHFFAQSSLTTYSVATERNIIKVPDDVPIGLAAIMAAKIDGAHPIIAVDISDDRLKMALFEASAARTRAPIDMITLLNGRTLKGIFQGDSISKIFLPKLSEFYKEGKISF